MRGKKKYGKKIALCILIGLLVSMFCGCEAIERLQAWKNGELQNEIGQEESPQTGQKDGIEQNPQTPKPPDANTTDFSSDAETRDILLYFADENGNLIAESRTILKEEGIAKSTILELIKGPQAVSSLLATIPQGVALRSVNIKEDGLCIVDFNDKLIYNHEDNAQKELLTVQSIVKTLGQFSSVQKVQILIEGQEVETIAGYVDISQPLLVDSASSE